jgi:GNAT superfamily N-acetyltransferase
MRIRIATREDIPGIAKVHVDSWRTTYPGIVPDDFLAALSYERSAETWHWIFECAKTDGNFTYVAEDSPGSIAGFANGGTERTRDPFYKGELNAIYILQQHQGKGIGRRLVHEVARMLRQTGVDSMLVWALVDNHACRFYERLGGRKIREKTMEIGGRDCPEAAYGWPSISAISK